MSISWSAWWLLEWESVYALISPALTFIVLLLIIISFQLSVIIVQGVASPGDSVVCLSDRRPRRRRKDWSKKKQQQTNSL